MQQEIIRFIEAEKPPPDKYRFLLFADKREVELTNVFHECEPGRRKLVMKVVDIFGPVRVPYGTYGRMDSGPAANVEVTVWGHTS